MSRRLFAPSIILMFLLFFFTGCKPAEQTYYKSGEKLDTSTISRPELQDRLDEFKDVFVSRTKAAASQIDQVDDSPKVRKMTLLWRTRAIAALYNIFEHTQERAVLIDTWCLCIRLKDYVENGQGSTVFGSGQSIAIETCQELEGRISNLARQILGQELYNEMDKNVRSFALANPIQSGFAKTLIYATETRPGEPNPFQSALAIPLSPFRAFQGVEQTPAAIYDFSNTTRHLTDVIEELPESTRWQLLMLLYEIEETSISQSITKNLDKLSTGSKQIAESVERLPEIVRQVDQSQTGIQETLKQSQEAMARLSETAQVIEKTAQAWTQAAQATETAVQNMKSLKGSSENTVSLQDTAQAITEAAHQIQLLSAELPQTMETVDKHARLLSTAVTIRLAFLLILLFVLLITYRIICIKLHKGGKS